MRKLLSLIVVLQFVSALPVMATDKGVSSCSSVATTKSESPAGQVKQQKKNQEDSSDMKARLATTKPEKYMVYFAWPKIEDGKVKVHTPGWLLPAYRFNLTVGYRF